MFLPLAFVVLTPTGHTAQQAAACSGELFQVAGLCIHGYDRQMADVCYHSTDPLLELVYSNPEFCALLDRSPKPSPLPSPTVTPSPTNDHQAVDCGQDANRIQVLYVRSTSEPDNYTDAVSAIRKAVMDGDSTLDASAASQGGHAHFRLLTNPGSCAIDVANVPTSEPIGNYGDVVNAVTDAGYPASGTRLYAIFVDMNSPSFCGVGNVANDSQPDPATNRNNSASEARYAVVWNNYPNGPGCWFGNDILHEISHTIGAVQLDAPHSTGAWHCTDGKDVMCYADGGPHDSPQTSTCSTVVYDCGHDDYFAVQPQGSYLPTHWNLARSKFLAVS